VQSALLTLLVALIFTTMPMTSTLANPGNYAGRASSLSEDASHVAMMPSVTDSFARSEPELNPVLSETPIPGISADSLIAIDMTSDVLLYQYNADVSIAPASTLKIITALTALEVLDPDEEISVSMEDLVDTTVYSNAALRAGDVVTVRDLLAGLLIPSGGDAANALARVAGVRFGPGPGQRPVERFVEEMNELAVDIGMTGSSFVNPDGRDEDGQYTTARDLAIAGAELLRDRMLAEIVAAPAWTMTVTGQNGRQYDVVNTNELIGVERVHGIKTGTTGSAGEAIVLATRRGNNQILTVVMGSEGRYTDTIALLQHLDDQLQWVEFGASSDFPGIQGAAERFGFVLAVPFVEPMDREVAERLYAELTLGPRPRGTLPVRWGHVVFFDDGEELYRVPVLLAGSSSQ
jgi:serine-type D-Ala-D-Ala carboxypeptidase (penicillin-binding protein 5/6)